MQKLLLSLSLVALLPLLPACTVSEGDDNKGGSGGSAGSSAGGSGGSNAAGSGTTGGSGGSGQAGSGQAGSGQAGSGQAGSGQAGSGQAGSGQAGSGQAGSGTGGDQEPPSQAGITAEHNKVRAGVSPAAVPAMPALEWSNEIAAVAQAWADGCNFEHSTSKYGENLYANAGSEPTPQEVVASWAAEVNDFDYAANDCAAGKACGHYTQVVWAASRKVGCGMAKCNKNSPFGGFPEWNIWVCNYDPPGNFNGQYPYCSASVTADCAK